MSPENHDTVEQVWREQRRRLIDIGYRMLGAVSDAEDVADEAYTRLVAADLDAIDDPTGWLVTVTSRLCIDRLRSADQRRRAYVGPWLPEPIVSRADPGAVDPADRVTLDDSVRLALLVVLEQLSPAERTSFVLHDLFSIDFDQIAEIVGRSPAACRQLASRARRRIQTHPEAPRAAVDRAELERVAQRFADACASGAIEELLEVLDPDVVGDFDSGGHIGAAPLDAIDGAVTIAQTLAWAFRDSRFTFAVDDVNGEPGVIARLGDRIVAVIALGIRDGRVDLIHAIGNPHKLRHLSRHRPQRPDRAALRQM
jgi:RNA polymerase sigma-70 factor (ECF subfamily)